MKDNPADISRSIALEPMIACVDVDYRESIAVAAGVWFLGWSAANAQQEELALFHDVADYQPGEFYRREMPCLLGVLEKGPEPNFIIIDGYVWLGKNRAGLGAHLHDALRNKCPIVGVAKSRFHNMTDALPVWRGNSRSPLYVTAIGVSPSEAANLVAAMDGCYRIPTMLKRADQLSKTSNVEKN